MYSREKVIELMKWLKNLDNGTVHINHHTKEESESIGFSPWDCFADDLKTEEELLIEFEKIKP